MTQLKPTLGSVQLLFYCVGVIVGAGVYSVIGTAAGIAGPSLWLSFLLAALVALLTGLAYAEMATSFPHAGAEYIYIKKALPESRFAPFAAGLVILVGSAATAATVAIAFGGYLRTFLDIPVGISAFALLMACTLLNMWGLREASWANILFTSIEVSGLLLIIAAGFSGGRMSEAVVVSFEPGLIPATALLFFVYLGFEEIANLAEEVHRPAQSLPRAIFLSIGITTLLYVLVALAATTLAEPGELARSQAPLTLAINAVWPAAGNALTAIALFATANTVLITVIAASRLAFSLSRDNELPLIFARVSEKRQTPWSGAVLVLVLSASLLPAGNLKILAEFSSFTALLAFLAVNVSLIVLRYRLPHHPRPFRTPLAIGRLPLIPLAAIGSIILLLANFDREIYLAGIALFAAIALAFVTRLGLLAIGLLPVTKKEPDLS